VLLCSVKGAAAGSFGNLADLSELGEFTTDLFTNEVDFAAIQVHRASSLQIQCRNPTVATCQHGGTILRQNHVLANQTKGD
jgi:hypothetical protein